MVLRRGKISPENRIAQERYGDEFGPWDSSTLFERIDFIF